MTGGVDLLTAVDMARSGFLSAPASFKTAQLPELRRVCNGCGAANAKFDFVPDTIYGLYIGHVCNIHDWRYEHGRTEEDRDEADREMRNNMLRLIDRACDDSWFYRRIKWLMRRRAKTYYAAVSSFGGPAFWSGKS